MIDKSLLISRSFMRYVKKVGTHARTAVFGVNGALLLGQAAAERIVHPLGAGRKVRA
jgi:hypothetical protein